MQKSPVTKNALKLEIKKYTIYVVVVNDLFNLAAARKEYSVIYVWSNSGSTSDNLREMLLEIFTILLSFLTWYTLQLFLLVVSSAEAPFCN